jgi:hypothetical protein
MKKFSSSGAGLRRLRPAFLLLLTACTLAAADTSFYIAPCTDPSTGCEPGDLDLARWALQSWQTASESAPSQNRLHFVETKEESKALLRFVWTSPAGGLYGETVGIDVNGKHGSQIYIVNTTRGIPDPLLRDTIVYLTCLHEAGHALGLSHTDQFADIMYYFGYGGDINEYFGRYRRKLSTRDDIRKNSGLSDADRRRLLAQLPLR